MAVTGGVRLQRMIADGKVNAPYLWLDAYNQITNIMAGTITTRVDAGACWFITTPPTRLDNPKYNKTDKRMIAQINTKTREVRHFDIRKLSPRECFRLMGVPEQYIDRMMQTEERTYRAIDGCEEALSLLALNDNATPRDIREAAEELINQNNNQNENEDDETETDAGTLPEDGGAGGVLDDPNAEWNATHPSRARIEQARDELLAAPRKEKTARVQTIANSALYKLAGNSIVCPVLMYIYEEFLYPTGRRLPAEQPSLFDLPQFRLQRRWADEPFRLISLCSGYDSQAMALDMLSQRHPDFRWQLTAWSEFDPESRRPIDEQPAVISHRLCFPDAGPNLGDMTRIDWQDFMNNPQKYYDEERRNESETDRRMLLESAGGIRETTAMGTVEDTESGRRTPSGDSDRVRINPGDIDLLTYSTPCQSISQAGKREGIAKGSGTRSSVLWSTEDAVAALRPKILLQENVRALVNQQNVGHFRQWCRTLEQHDYVNFLAPAFVTPDGQRTTPQVLNARDYNIPQNHDRVYMLSIRRDILGPSQYEFPRPLPLTRCIADVLEPDAPAALYLKPESVTSFLKKNEPPTDASTYLYHVTDHRLTPQEVEQIIKKATDGEG